MLLPELRCSEPDQLSGRSSWTPVPGLGSVDICPLSAEPKSYQHGSDQPVYKFAAVPPPLPAHTSITEVHKTSERECQYLHTSSTPNQMFSCRISEGL